MTVRNVLFYMAFLHGGQNDNGALEQSYSFCKQTLKTFVLKQSVLTYSQAHGVIGVAQLLLSPPQKKIPLHID